MHNCNQKQYYTQDGSQIKINSNIAIFFQQIQTNQQTIEADTKYEQEKPKWLPPYKESMLEKIVNMHNHNINQRPVALHEQQC